MRCLVISPTPTHPQDAGNRQRIHALLSALRGFGHQVEFAFVQREAVVPEAIEAMRAAWDRLHLIPYDRTAESPSLGETFALDDWFPPALEEAIAALAQAGSYDLVLVEYVFLSRALELFPPGTLKLLDTHDVFADRHHRLEALGLPIGFFHTSSAEEARGLDRADLVLAIQDDERQAFEEVTESPVVTLGFMPEVQPLSPAPHAALRIGYLGSGNPLNGHALARFLQALDAETLPALGAEMRVAGGASRFAGPARPGLLPMGGVGSPADFYRGIDLVVNPHEGGTGLKIKTVEALAYGLPVIGTAEAFRGLGARAAFHAAPDAAAVAALARRWAREPRFRREVARESAALAARYAREVRRQLAPFRSRAALQALIDRPRALLVTDIPFWRESLGNQARIAAMLRAARGEMDLDTLFLGPLEPEDADAAFAVLGRRGRLLASPGDPAGRLEEPVPDNAKLTPFERRYFDAAHFEVLEGVLAGSGGYSILILEYIRLSYLRHAQPAPPIRVLDTHDVMSLRTQNFEHFGREHFLRISTLEELGIMDGFEQVLAIQDAEHALLRGAMPGRSLLLPHTLPDMPCAPARQEARRIVFLGGDSPMNRDGIRWFIDQAWPAIAGLGAELHVAGRVCDALADFRARGLVLHGEVENPVAFLEAADIGINPVFYGGGLKIKTVEYLCQGLPSVLSEEGAFGLTGGEGSAYLVARSRAEYVAHLRNLIRDPLRRQRLGEGAFHFGRARFGTPAARAACRTLASLALAFQDSALALAPGASPLARAA
ncbi:Glycosyltransferase involved in cell wall bisynthesis [Roseomonas rosea]|uniref:Glycosyltransferase involved in cell wall bisynthesis n=1 Tax=Muricoccus roseus TaxID=198092 RepID=A0A1M6EXC2_9PROT|nr:glycosyltransferase [Roseomonas rosea]SHI90144.1 Glycosyltransferase involved in cell wall bisynthesis [Roseomonas rosea]